MSWGCIWDWKIQPLPERGEVQVKVAARIDRTHNPLVKLTG